MAHCSYCPNAAASASPAGRLHRMPRPGPPVASRTPPRLKAYEGVPPPYDRTKRMVIPNALKVLRLQPGHRYCLLGQLSKEVGWNYAHTIRLAVTSLVLY
ncbi:60S ribosomal protein L13a [Triticum aestivum]|uniref:60S ribosomal protein L13a n=1 Tax=Triticum aestivum TaxID=4565 RepID=UPI001D021E60|nr:60S ribosomal protein L13a-like [Triticum aestivum]